MDGRYKMSENRPPPKRNRGLPFGVILCVIQISYFVCMHRAEINTFRYIRKHPGHDYRIKHIRVSGFRCGFPEVTSRYVRDAS